MKCPTCKGKKKIEVGVHEKGSVTKVKIICIDCSGTGSVTQEQFNSISYFKNMWCKCGSPNGSTYHPDTKKMKHHYTCNNCGKITQIG